MDDRNRMKAVFGVGLLVGLLLSTGCRSRPLQEVVGQDVFDSVAGTNEVDVQPVVITNGYAEYPVEMVKRNASGEVKFSFVVGTNGTVRERVKAL